MSEDNSCERVNQSINNIISSGVNFNDCNLNNIKNEDNFYSFKYEDDDEDLTVVTGDDIDFDDDNNSNDIFNKNNNINYENYIDNDNFEDVVREGRAEHEAQTLDGRLVLNQLQQENKMLEPNMRRVVPLNNEGASEVTIGQNAALGGSCSRIRKFNNRLRLYGNNNTNDTNGPSSTSATASPQLQQLAEEVKLLRTQLASQSKDLQAAVAESNKQAKLITALGNKLDRANSTNAELTKKLQLSHVAQETQKKTITLLERDAMGGGSKRVNNKAKNVNSEGNNKRSLEKTKANSDNTENDEDNNLATKAKKLSYENKILRSALVKLQNNTNNNNDNSNNNAVDDSKIIEQILQELNLPLLSLFYDDIPSKNEVKDIEKDAMIDELRADKVKLETQRVSLVSCVHKQNKLIDLLRRQKLHLEASKLLQLTEEEFVRALEAGDN